MILLFYPDSSCCLFAIFLLYPPPVHFSTRNSIQICIQLFMHMFYFNTCLGLLYMYNFFLFMHLAQQKSDVQTFAVQFLRGRGDTA